MIEQEIDPKYGAIKKSIVDVLRQYENTYFREDKPIPFLPEITLYPVEVRNFEEFAYCSSCLSLNKNEDPAGVKMSHLDYLLSRVDLPAPEGQTWAYKIYKLFEIVCRLKPGYECKSCSNVIGYDSKEARDFSNSYQEFVQKLVLMAQDSLASEEEAKALIADEPHLTCPQCSGTDFDHSIKISVDNETKQKKLIIHGHVVTRGEFEQLRQIILFQNFPDYVDDSWVDPELKKDRDEKARLEQKMHDLHATIEQKVVCLSISTNYKFSEIFDMPIRKFTMALAKVDELINYKLLKQAQYSGLTSFPKDFKIEHWIYKPNKDMYGDSYRSTDSIQAV